VRHRHELEQCADGAMPPVMGDLALASTCQRPDIAAYATQFRPRCTPTPLVLLQHPPDHLLGNLVREKLAQGVGLLAPRTGVELASECRRVGLPRLRSTLRIFRL
jgi:hypothetical protein